MGLDGEIVHCLRHAIQEELLGLLLRAVAVWRGDEFLSLRHGDGGKQIGKNA